ncbi:MAG: CvpA family protein [Phycisphaerae bacterium]|jgi:hypothetical protein
MQIDPGATTADPLRFACAGCARTLDVSPAFAGRRVRCPHCGTTQAAPEVRKSIDAEESFTAPPPPALLAARITLGIVAAAALAATLAGGTATRFMAVLVLLLSVQGYMLGAANIVAAILGMALSASLAAPVGRWLEGLSRGLFATTGLTNRMIGIGLGALLVFMLVTPAAAWLIRRAKRRTHAWRRHDRLGGVVLGALEGTLLGVLVFWGVLALEPIAARAIAQAHGGESWSASRILDMAGAVRSSSIGRAADAVNPLANLHVLTLADRVQRMLNDPDATDRFLSHEGMQRLREHPAVKRALERLAEPPPIIDFEDGVSDEELMTLFDSPRLLAILDETNLFAELAPLAGEIEAALNDALTQTAP